MILNYKSFMLLHPKDETPHLVKIQNIRRRYEHGNAQLEKHSCQLLISLPCYVDFSRV